MKCFKALFLKIFLITLIAIITIGLDFLAAILSKETLNLLLSLINRDAFGSILDFIFDKLDVILLNLISIIYLFIGLILVFIISYLLGDKIFNKKFGDQKYKMPISIKMMMLFVLVFIFTPTVNPFTNDILTSFYSSQIGTLVVTVKDSLYELFMNEFFYENLDVIYHLIADIPLFVLMIPTLMLFYVVGHKTSVWIFEKMFNKTC